MLRFQSSKEHSSIGLPVPPVPHKRTIITHRTRGISRFLTVSFSRDIFSFNVARNTRERIVAVYQRLSNSPELFHDDLEAE